MFCPKCGTQIADDAKFCPSCGEKIGSSVQQSSPSQQQTPNYANDPSGSDPFQTTNTQTPNSGFQNTVAQTFSPEQSNAVSMKWFKFLIYFALFAGALVNFITGISILTGLQYGEEKTLVYNYFAGLKTLDSVFGVLSVLIAIFGIYTRFRLASYRRNGPICLYTLYILNVTTSFIYLFAVSAVTTLSISQLSDASTFSEIIVSVCMVVVNIIYFKKRSQLFVN